MCGDSTTLIRPNQCHTVTTGQLEASLITQCLLHSANTSSDSSQAINCSAFYLLPKTQPFRLGCMSVFLYLMNPQFSTSVFFYLTDSYSTPKFDLNDIPHSDHWSTTAPQSQLCGQVSVISGPLGPSSLGWSCDIYFSPLETRQPPRWLQRSPCPTITDGSTLLICFSISYVQTA